MFPYLFPLASPSLPPSLSHPGVILNVSALQPETTRNTSLVEQTEFTHCSEGGYTA